MSILTKKDCGDRVILVMSPYIISKNGELCNDFPIMIIEKKTKKITVQLMIIILIEAIQIIFINHIQLLILVFLQINNHIKKRNLLLHIIIFRTKAILQTTLAIIMKIKFVKN